MINVNVNIADCCEHARMKFSS